jgi:hypothetical protein
MVASVGWVSEALPIVFPDERASSPLIPDDAWVRFGFGWEAVCLFTVVRTVKTDIRTEHSHQLDN